MSRGTLIGKTAKTQIGTGFPQDRRLTQALLGWFSLGGHKFQVLIFIPARLPCSSGLLCPLIELPFPPGGVSDILVASRNLLSVFPSHQAFAIVGLNFTSGMKLLWLHSAVSPLRDLSCLHRCLHSLCRLFYGQWSQKLLLKLIGFSEEK